MEQMLAVQLYHFVLVFVLELLQTNNTFFDISVFFRIVASGSFRQILVNSRGYILSYVIDANSVSIIRNV